MTKILFHEIDWFLDSRKEMELQEGWEQEIKDFIYDWVREWIFMVFYEWKKWKEITDNLYWKINLSKN